MYIVNILLVEAVREITKIFVTFSKNYSVMKCLTAQTRDAGFNLMKSLIARNPKLFTHVLGLVQSNASTSNNKTASSNRSDVRKKLSQNF